MCPGPYVPTYVPSPYVSVCVQPYVPACVGFCHLYVPAYVLLCGWSYVPNAAGRGSFCSSVSQRGPRRICCGAVTIRVQMRRIPKAGAFARRPDRVCGWLEGLASRSQCRVPGGACAADRIRFAPRLLWPVREELWVCHLGFFHHYSEFAHLPIIAPTAGLDANASRSDWFDDKTAPPESL